MSARTRLPLMSLALVVMALATAAPVSAASVEGPDTLRFDADPNSFVSSPFTSRDNPTIHFRATRGTLGIFLNIVDPGLGLHASNGTEAGLGIRFDVPTRRLSIPFGNDGDMDARATLKVYRGDKLIETIHVPLNGTAAIDQVAEYEGAPITRASFVYNIEGDRNVEGDEEVDDIVLAQICTISGGAGANVLVGNGGANGICGRGGADRISGQAGNDVLRGGPGNDRLRGGANNDLLDGGLGDDILIGGRGRDTLYGGPGTDTCILGPGDTAFGCES